MRVRTEDRRQAIIEVALGVFREHGFERSSMAMISRRLGGSKGTLYGYFKSKEDLFETTMKTASEGPGDQIMDLLDPKAKDVGAMLCKFAAAYRGFIQSDEVLRITRTAIHEGAGSSLGPHLFDQGPGRALSKLSNFFADMVERGKLREAPPEQVARHFKGLIEAGVLEEALYGAATISDKATAEGIAAFMRAYAA
ncbi:TetR/AcrR family transcriptional regulator [uncultured Sphingomonas sp.]|uniref:TetR/AcrR family transcriptional regulator n=1 Tax=uncultured Sphingomonas sp. TaxID=158754 RepID=UPI0035CB392C